MNNKFLHSSINFALLCGGESQRMGEDKALLKFDGHTLIERICENIEPLIENRFVDELLILSNNKRYDIIEKYKPIYLDDFIPDSQGPLSALCAALNYSFQQGNKWLITTPCDTLLLPSDILPALSSAILTNTQYHLYYFVTKNHREHPLFAIYNTELCHSLQDYVIAGKRRVLDYIHAQKAAMITMPDEWPAFCNFNTLAAFDKACNNYRLYDQ